MNQIFKLVAFRLRSAGDNLDSGLFHDLPIGNPAQAAHAQSGDKAVVYEIRDIPMENGFPVFSRLFAFVEKSNRPLVSSCAAPDLVRASFQLTNGSDHVALD